MVKIANHAPSLRRFPAMCRSTLQRFT